MTGRLTYVASAFTLVFTHTLPLNHHCALREMVCREI